MMDTSSECIHRNNNVLGLEMDVLVREVKEAGSYSAVLNAAGMPSGAYFCRADATPTTGATAVALDVRKLLLIK